MSPETKKLLKTFAKNANWKTVGMPDDTARFFDFIIAAYRNGDRDISLDDFLEIIKPFVKSREDDVTTTKRILVTEMFMHGKYEDGIKLLHKSERI